MRRRTDKGRIMKFTRYVAWLIVGAGLSGLNSLPAAQSDYPNKPIRFIVPFPPGGNVDLMARAIGQKLSENFSQQIVIDNRPGAAGIIGTEMAAKAPANGYTMLMGSIGALSINPSIYRKLPYDPVKSFSPVTLATVTPNLLVVHPLLPVNSVKELIALARSKPGQLNFASGGTGTGNHLTMELFNAMAGIRVVHVPYKGAPLAITDLIAGQVQIMTPPMPATVPHIKAGRLKALAVTSAKRNKAVPELPTVAEAGVPGYDADSWYGVLVPAGTPKTIIDKLHAEIITILTTPEVATYLANQGAEVSTTTPAQFGSFIKTEVAKWAKVVRISGIRLE